MEGGEKKKRFQRFGQLWNYCRSHMWCSFAMAILIGTDITEENAGLNSPQMIYG